MSSPSEVRFPAIVHSSGLLFADVDEFTETSSPVYGEKEIMLSYRSIDLFWRPVGILVRFVLVIHPQRGRLILMSTDLSLKPECIIKLYGIRFKI
jgi:hypothetical protein